MTAEEIVMSGYAAFGSGDMDALGKLYHPQCKTTFHGDHALGGEYIGFPDLLTNMLAKLNDAWPGFSLGVDKVVADDKNVCVFCTITADGGLIGPRFRLPVSHRRGPRGMALGPNVQLRRQAHRR